MYIRIWPQYMSKVSPSSVHPEIYSQSVFVCHNPYINMPTSFTFLLEWLIKYFSWESSKLLHKKHHIIEVPRWYSVRSSVNTFCIFLWWFLSVFLFKYFIDVCKCIITQTYRPDVRCETWNAHFMNWILFSLLSIWSTQRI